MTPRKTLSPAELRALYRKTAKAIEETAAVRADVSERLIDHLAQAGDDAPTPEDCARRARIARGGTLDV